MDVAFFMGLLAGFFMGIGFTIYFTKTITYKIVEILDEAYGHKIKKKKKFEEEEDGSNWWKPPGWEPE